MEDDILRLISKNMTLHREKMFDKIGKDLLVMSKMVFKQMQLVSDRLGCKEVEGYIEDIANNELIIDGLETKIRKNVIGAIVLYTPRASDLRKIMACYDIAISLERTGDLLLNVNRSLDKVDLDGEIFQELKEELLTIMSIADKMVKNAIYSFTCEDITLTRETLKNDDVVDKMYLDITQEIVSLSTGKTLDKQKIEEAMSLSALTHNIERIADYATNIVEAAVYLIEGKNIQHKKFD